MVSSSSVVGMRRRWLAFFAPFVLAGHADAGGFERKLVDYVEQKCSTSQGPACGAANVGDAFDDFCVKFAPGQCLGAQKGLVLTATASKAAKSKTGKSSRLVVVETGAHHGDGSMRLVAALEHSVKTEGVRRPRLLIMTDSNREAKTINKLLEISSGTKEGSVSTEVSVHALIGDGKREEELPTALSDILDTKVILDVLVLDGEPEEYAAIVTNLLIGGRLNAGSQVIVDNWGRKKAAMKSLRELVKAPPEQVTDLGFYFNVELNLIDTPYKDEIAVISVLGGAARGATDL